MSLNTHLIYHTELRRVLSSLNLQITWTVWPGLIKTGRIFFLSFTTKALDIIFRSKFSKEKVLQSETYLLSLFGFSSNLIIKKDAFNPIQDGLYRGCSWMGGGGFLAPLPKICHTYRKMIKLGRVIPYPRKTQKIYKSRDTYLEFCWRQHFFARNQQILLHQKIQV